MRVYRQQVYNRGSMYRLMLSLSKRVFPGDSLYINVKGTLETDIVASLRVPAIMSTYAFYVPHRLVMTNFIDFISDPDTAIALPLSNTAFPEIGEGTAFQNVMLFRRSVKLAYNTFFGDKDYASALYADPLLDTAQNVMLPLKTVNQLLGAISLDVDRPADNYTVVASTIELTDFRRRLQVNRRNINQRVGGEKYSDVLARYGVKLDDNLINQPEMIGMKSEVIYPQEIMNTSDINTGARVGRFRASVQYNSKRIFCPEHGYVFVMHALRPFLSRTLPPAERNFFGRNKMMEESSERYDERVSTSFGTATDVEPDPIIPFYADVHMGDMHAFNGVTGTLGYAANAAIADLVYPSVATDPKVDIGISGEISFNSVTK